MFSIGSNSYNVKQSIISNVPGIENDDEYKYSYARVLFDKTEGMNFDIAANREVFVEDVIKYIYGKVSTEAGAYNAIIATGYHTIVLDKPLTEHDMELAEKLYNNPEYAFSEEEVKDCADTDRDGLFDFEEVMFYSDYIKGNEFIKFDNGKIVLPQIADIFRIYEVNGEYAYVDGGVENARKQYGDYWAIFLTEPVLPIISDPTKSDSDGDNWIDSQDVYKLKYQNLIFSAAKVGTGSWYDTLKGLIPGVSSSNSMQDYTSFIDEMNKNFNGLTLPNGLYKNNFVVESSFNKHNMIDILQSDVTYISGHGSRGGIIPIYPSANAGYRDSTAEKNYNQIFTTNAKIKWNDFQNFDNENEVIGENIFSFNSCDRNQITKYRLQWAILAACCQLETYDDRSDYQKQKKWNEESLYNWANVLENSTTMKGVLGYYHAAPGANSNLQDYKIIEKFCEYSQEENDLLSSWICANSWYDETLEKLGSRRCGILVKGNALSSNLLDSLHEEISSNEYYYFKLVTLGNGNNDTEMSEKEGNGVYNYPYLLKSLNIYKCNSCDSSLQLMSCIDLSDVETISDLQITVSGVL